MEKWFLENHLTVILHPTKDQRHLRQNLCNKIMVRQEFPTIKRNRKTRAKETKHKCTKLTAQSRLYFETSASVLPCS